MEESFNDRLQEVMKPATDPRESPKKRKRPTNFDKPIETPTQQLNLNLPADLVQRIKLAGMVANQTASEIVEIYLTAGKKLPDYIITEKD